MARIVPIGRAFASALAISTALSGCSALSVAGLALNLLAPQPSSGREVFRNPIDRAPSDQLQEALTGIDRGVTSQCRALLERIREASPKSEEPSDPPTSCRTRLVCVGGATEPTAVMMCPNPNAELQTTPAATTPDPELDMVMEVSDSDVTDLQDAGTETPGTPDFAMTTWHWR